MNNFTISVINLVQDLEADLNKDRFEIHGIGGVDDDYYIALEYCINKLRSIVKEHYSE